MSRMTLLFVVFALTLSPSSTVLCGMWCNSSTDGLTDTATPCSHHAAPAASTELSGGNDCGTPGITPAVYVRENSELRGVPRLVVTHDGGHDYLGGTRSSHMSHLPARQGALHTQASLTPLRI